MMKKARIRSEWNGADENFRPTIGVKLDGSRVQWNVDDNGNLHLMFNAEVAPYFDGQRLTPEFEEHLQGLGLSVGAILDKISDAIEDEERVAAFRSAMM
jgi:hypothetical protein